jgi:hypothetical protein
MSPHRLGFWVFVADMLVWAGFFGSKAFLYAIGKASEANGFGIPLESSRWDEDERDVW